MLSQAEADGAYAQRRKDVRAGVVIGLDAASSSALLLAFGEEAELVEVDFLVAGSAAAVPALEDGLDEPYSNSAAP